MPETERNAPNTTPSAEEGRPLDGKHYWLAREGTTAADIVTQALREYTDISKAWVGAVRKIEQHLGLPELPSTAKFDIKLKGGKVTGVWFIADSKTMDAIVKACPAFRHGNIPRMGRGVKLDIRSPEAKSLAALISEPLPDMMDRRRVLSKALNDKRADWFMLQPGIQGLGQIGYLVIVPHDDMFTAHKDWNEALRDHGFDALKTSEAMRFLEDKAKEAVHA